MMTHETYFQNFAVPITNGQCDEFLNAIILCAQDRQKALSTKIYQCYAGQRVRFSSNVNPKYLAGVEGTVSKVNRTKVVVDLDKKTGRFHRNIATPLAMVEII